APATRGATSRPKPTDRSRIPREEPHSSYALFLDRPSHLRALKDLDAGVGVAGVANEYVSAAIHGDSRRSSELPVPAAEAPPLRDECASVRELLDSVVVGVGDEDVPDAIHRD